MTTRGMLLVWGAGGLRLCWISECLLIPWIREYRECCIRRLNWGRFAVASVFQARGLEMGQGECVCVCVNAYVAYVLNQENK